MKISYYALIDLHLQLDGALSPEALCEMARISNINLPTTDLNELRAFMECPEDCESLNDYLECFDFPQQVMQHKDAIEYGVYDLVKRLDKQGLLYAEIRYAPQLHLENGLTQDEVVQASISGLNAALAECDMQAQLILCCMRGDNNDELNKTTVELTKKYLGRGVAACDLAGAEALFKTEKYKSLFDYAASLGVPYTIHAGEADEVSSMQDAISFGTHRIGHGIRSYNDNHTLTLLYDKNITLELCPTSNLQTKAVGSINSMSQYPICEFINRNVKVTVNTDNMTVSNTTLLKEFQKLFKFGVINSEQAEIIVRNSVDAAFLSDDQKKDLLEKCQKIMRR